MYNLVHYTWFTNSRYSSFMSWYTTPGVLTQGKYLARSGPSDHRCPRHQAEVSSRLGCPWFGSVWTVYDIDNREGNLQHPATLKQAVAHNTQANNDIMHPCNENCGLRKLAPFLNDKRYEWLPRKSKCCWWSSFVNIMISWFSSCQQFPAS